MKKQEPLEAKIRGEKATAQIAWTFQNDGPMNFVGKEFPYDFNGPAGDGERRANRSAFFSELSIDPQHTVTPKLVHGGKVRYVNVHNRYIEDLICDGLVTDTPGLVLTVGFADCPPVVIFDDHARVLALLHAGWKPISEEILENSLSLMRQLGAHPSRMQVFVGPSIRRCCYEVGPDVATKVDGLRHDGTLYIDLPEIISVRLSARGVPIENISLHPTCVCCGTVDTKTGEKPLYYSYRREKKADPLNTNMLIASFS